MSAPDDILPELMKVLLEQLKTIQKLTQESMQCVAENKLSEQGNEIKKWLKTLDEGFSCMRTQARKDVQLAAFILLQLSENESFARSNGLEEIQELETKMTSIVAKAQDMTSEIDETKISVQGLMDKTQTVKLDTSIAMIMTLRGLVTGSAVVGCLELLPCCGAAGTLAMGSLVVTGPYLALAIAVGAVIGALLIGTAGLICDKVREIKFANKLSELQGALKKMHHLLDENSTKIQSLKVMAEDGSVSAGTLSGIIIFWKKGGASWETAREQLQKSSNAFTAMGESLKHAGEGGQGTSLTRKAATVAAGVAIGGAAWNWTCLMRFIYNKK